MHTMDKYMNQNPNATMLPESLNSMNPEFPPHLQSAFFSTSTEHYDGVEIDPRLIGTTISFFDGKTGKIMECTVQDYGTSQLRGDWVEVVYNDTRDSELLRISLGEMKEILANRVA
jgi:hypothetical protein